MGPLRPSGAADVGEAKPEAPGGPEEPNGPARVFVPGNHLMVSLLGHRDEHLRDIERSYPGHRIVVRGNEIAIEGPSASQIARLFEELVVLVQRGHDTDAASLQRTIEMVRADERPSQVLTAEVLRAGKGRTVRPKTSGQKRYADAINY